MHLPVDDLIPTRIGLSLVCPCDEGIVRSTMQAAQIVFKSEAVALNRYLSWLDRNPFILVALIDEFGEVRGAFDILPLEDAFLDAFVAGSLTESDISPEMILPPDRMSFCRRLYLGGILVTDPATHSSRRYASMLVWGVMRYLHRYYQTGAPSDLLAIASTEAGERLLRGFRFSLQIGASRRVDQHDLFAHPINRAGRMRLESLVPDWSRQCEVDFRGDHAVIRLFVSYRRDDSAAITGRAVDRLRTAFGVDAVFLDIESIDLGIDFRAVVEDSIRESAVLIVMIGPDWLTAVHERRSAGLEDHVLTEVRIALEGGKAVLPILIGDTLMPAPMDLPEEVRDLAYRNAARLDPAARFESDILSIIAAVGRLTNVVT